MKLTSIAFDHEGEIPSLYTCDGDNISPPLEISDVPEGTESFVLLVEDPDAVSGVFVHWLVFNIDPGVRKIEEGEMPRSGEQGLTGFGNTEYGGPCPPDGRHRYLFTLYALDSMIDIEPGTTKEHVLEIIEDHILAKTTLMGTYERQ